MEHIQEPSDQLRQVTSFSKDLLSIFISLILGLMLVIFSNYLLGDSNIFLVILGFIVIIYGFIIISRAITDFGSAKNYYKAQQEVSGLYLRKSSPVCPYLKTSYSGFRCLIEFQQNFDVATDLPKCHVESAFKNHWQEKAPMVLEQAKNSTDRNLVTYLNMLGKARYEPALSLMQEIFMTPIINKKSLFIYEQANPNTIKSLKDSFVEVFSTTDETASLEEQDTYRQETMKDFDSTLHDLVTFGIVQQDGENIQKTGLSLTENFNLKWKLYSTPLVKQFALGSMSNYENPKLIPMFFEVFINSSDSKMIQLASNGLIRLKEHVEEPLLSYIGDSTIPSNKKSELIELAGKIKSDKLFETLEELAKSGDETLSYFAISSLGKYDEKGFQVILEILQDNPTDLKIDSGRSTLALNPRLCFKVITNFLDENSKFSEEFYQILTSILDEFEHTEIKAYFKSQSESEQERIDSVFEKHNLLDHLDYLLS